jgi:hypothetical protein
MTRILKKIRQAIESQTILGRMKSFTTPTALASLCLWTIGFLCAQAASGSRADAVDWLTLPGRYTHTPTTGQRINQYAQVEAPPLVDQTARVSSGYTHYRSTIQVGQSADNYHRVDQWGPPVRPYGEWQFPFRPYSAPYQDWGAPFAGLNLGFGFPGVGFPPHGGGNWGGGGGGGNWGGGNGGGGNWGNGNNGNWGGGFPGSGFPGGGIPGQPINPYPINPNGPYPVPPWFDGFHPDLPFRPRLDDRDFFRGPSTTSPPSTGLPIAP